MEYNINITLNLIFILKAERRLKGGYSVPVIPRPASTVVLMDSKGRIYLTKRPKTMKFLGGYYVFPGGSVEKADYLTNPDYLVGNPEIDSYDTAYYVAAAREIFEEVGILLAEKRDGSYLHLDEKTAGAYRKMLIQGEMSFIELLEEEDLCLFLDSLTYFGTQVTPAESRYRFKTRFFFTNLPIGQSPVPCQHEIAEAFWIAPEKALHAVKNGFLPMADPTILSLEAIIQFQKGNSLKLPNC